MSCFIALIVMLCDGCMRCIGAARAVLVHLMPVGKSESGHDDMVGRVWANGCQIQTCLQGTDWSATGPCQRQCVLLHSLQMTHCDIYQRFRCDVAPCVQGRAPSQPATCSTAASDCSDRCATQVFKPWALADPAASSCMIVQDNVVV